MTRKLGQRGTASFEFCLVAVPFFTLVFTIFDLGRYAITVQSLRALAESAARAVIINCYQSQAIAHQSPSTCANSTSLTGTWYPTASQKALAPFLFYDGLTPTLTVTGSTSPLTVTASQPNFTMLMPIWGSSLNAPHASTTIPF